MTCVPYNSFTWGGVTLYPLSESNVTIIDWIQEPKQQERHVAGTQRVQIATFGYVWRWIGSVWVSSTSDYGVLRTAWLAQPRTISTWDNGIVSYQATLTVFNLLPLADGTQGYTGQIAFVRTS